MTTTPDLASFERLYRSINPRLQRFVRAQEREETDDICADVWESVAAYLDRFEGDDGGFEALVFTIARRRITDLRRKRTRRRTDLVDHDAFRDLAGLDVTDIEAINQLWTVAMLEELVVALTPVQVEIVLLRIILGLSVERVAALLGRSPGNVRIIQHRALKRLRTP